MQPLGSEQQLEAVLAGRVVRGGDHHPAVEAEIVHGEGDARRGAEPDAHHLRAPRSQAVDQRPFERGRAQPAVAADHEASEPAGPGVGGVGKSERSRAGRIDVGADDAPDVVGADCARPDPGLGLFREKTRGATLGGPKAGAPS